MNLEITIDHIMSPWLKTINSETLLFKETLINDIELFIITVCTITTTNELIINFVCYMICI